MPDHRPYMDLAEPGFKLRYSAAGSKN